MLRPDLFGTMKNVHLKTTNPVEGINRWSKDKEEKSALSAMLERYQLVSLCWFSGLILNSLHVAGMTKTG